MMWNPKAFWALPLALLVGLFSEAEALIKK
jgi:hypothetical protein